MNHRPYGVQCKIPGCGTIIHSTTEQSAWQSLEQHLLAWHEEVWDMFKQVRVMSGNPGG